MLRSLTTPLLIGLVLAQSGLAVGHCHEISLKSPNRGLRHVHLDLLIGFGSSPVTPHEDSDSHDDWAISDPGTMAPLAKWSPPPLAVAAVLPPPFDFDLSTTEAWRQTPHFAPPDRALYLALHVLRN